jgi:hypothetical protein
MNTRHCRRFCRHCWSAVSFTIGTCGARPPDCISLAPAKPFYDRPPSRAHFVEDFGELE